MIIKKYVILPLLCIPLLTGCSNGMFDKAMEEGKIAIASKDYEKAESMLGLAIEEKKNDKEANALYSQIEKLNEAIKLKNEGKIEEAKKLCNEISKIDTKSDVIKKEAIVLNEQIRTLAESNNKFKNEIEKGIKNAEDLMASKKYADAKIKLSSVIEQIGDNEVLRSELDKSNKLLKTCEEKINQFKEEARKREEAKKQDIGKVYSKSEVMSLVEKKMEVLDARSNAEYEPDKQINDELAYSVEIEYTTGNGMPRLDQFHVGSKSLNVYNSWDESLRMSLR